MDLALVGFAFAAGLVAALNPCGFAMLPAYLVLVVRGEGGETDLAAGGPPIWGRVVRALTATLVMAMGFLAVFGAFGALTLSAATTVQRYLPYLTVLIGIVLVALGSWLLSGRELLALTPKPVGAQWAPTTRIGSMFAYGISYAIASLSCTIGPFLAVTATAFRSGTALTTGLVYLAYVGGLALVVGVLAIAVTIAGSALTDRIRRLLPYVNRISGVLMTLVGLYVGYYGLYEVRLFGVNGDPRDSVITAAGHVQGVLAGWVHRYGAWPWVLALAVLVLTALLWARRGRVRQ